jgi:hypothetical protein
VSESAAETLRPLLYGSVPIDQWPDEHSPAVSTEPWASFVRARALFGDGEADGAVSIWRHIAESAGIESRHTLQAWHFLRSVGVEPPDDVAALALGALAEVAVDVGHDVLVAYGDGSVRYLNHGGQVVVVEPPVPAPVANAAGPWLAVAQRLALVVGVWAQPQLPALPEGHTRVTMLTPGGARFGQGPDGELRQDAGASAFLAAATNLLVAVTPL